MGGGKGIIGLVDAFTDNSISGMVSDDVNTFMANMNPGGAMTKQAVTNVTNVLKGTEAFGSHRNWFGNSVLGETLNPLVGGMTKAQREQDDANIKAWNDFYTGKLNRALTGSKTDTNTGSSLLED